MPFEARKTIWSGGKARSASTHRRQMEPPKEVAHLGLAGEQAERK